MPKTGPVRVMADVHKGDSAIVQHTYDAVVKAFFLTGGFANVSLRIMMCNGIDIFVIWERSGHGYSG